MANYIFCWIGLRYS